MMLHTEASDATRTNEEVVERQERRRRKEIFVVVMVFGLVWLLFCLFVFALFACLLAYSVLFSLVGGCSRDEGRIWGDWEVSLIGTNP